MSDNDPSLVELGTLQPGDLFMFWVGHGARVSRSMNEYLRRGPRAEALYGNGVYWVCCRSNGYPDRWATSNAMVIKK